MSFTVDEREESGERDSRRSRRDAEMYVGSRRSRRRQSRRAAGATSVSVVRQPDDDALPGAAAGVSDATAR